MRAYHFVKADYGFEDIRLRRLKVATFDELNDPFELLGFNLRDKTLRRGLPVVKERAGEKMGLLCFSRNWHNPVMWSHYGDRHTGLCLGFEVPDHGMLKVMYSRRRVPVALEDFERPSRDMDFVLTCLFTKYSHWRYEDEVRLLVRLEETERDGDWHFGAFRRRTLPRERDCRGAVARDSGRGK